VIARILVAGCLCILGAACTTTGVAAKDPSAPNVSRGEALALVAQARARLENGEVTEGLQLFRRASELDPTSDELAEEYGIALAEAGVVREAVAQLQRAEVLTPAGEALLGILLAQGNEDPGQLEAAVPHLEAGLTAFPQGDHARVVLVQTQIRLGRGEAALANLQPLLTERAGDPRVQLMAGQALRLAGRLDEAEGYLRQASAAPATRVRAALELVETLAAGKKYREAADLLGEFMRSDGATLDGLTRLATLLVRAGDQDAAKKVLDDVIARDENFRDALILRALLAAGEGDVEQTERLYRKALAANPGDPDVALGLARLLTDLRRFPEARILVQGVWARIESTKLAVTPPGVEVAQEAATIELLDDNPDAAKVWLDRTLVQPVGQRTLALWAEYFRLRKEYREGLAWLAVPPACEGAGLDGQRRAIEGEFLLALGDEARAGETLAPLFEGGEEDILSGLGVLQRRRRSQDVVDHARRALERFPESTDIRFTLAAGLERTGGWDEAEKEFRAVIAAEPDNASALNYLGYMFADRGVNLDEAKELIEKAVGLDPTSGAYQDSLGWVHFRLGDLGLAEKHLTRAASLEPRDATVSEHLADLYKALGYSDRAAEAYRRALALEPDEEGQRERIEAKLAEIAGAPAP
jgi:tetratricopeptide (TPR) repeat protein